MPIATAITNALKSLTIAPEKQGSWDKSFCLLMLCLVALMPEVAIAAPWDGPLQNLIDLLTGTTARLLAILSIIVLGFMAMTGRMSWGLGGSIVGGIVLVFGASWIADNFISVV